MQQQGQCKDCRFPYKAIGLLSRPLICGNYPGLDGRYIIVQPDGCCPNFEPRYPEQEIWPSEPQDPFDFGS